MVGVEKLSRIRLFGSKGNLKAFSFFRKEVLNGIFRRINSYSADNNFTGTIIFSVKYASSMKNDEITKKREKGEKHSEGPGIWREN